MERLRKCTIPEYCIQPKDTNHIRIVLLNVRGLLCHKSDVFSDPLILAADVICFTETRLLPSNTSPLLPDFHIYREDRLPSQSGHGGGIAIYCRTQLTQSLLDIHSRLESLCLKISTSNDSITIILVYRPPAQHSPTIVKQFFLQSLDTLFSTTVLENQKLLLLGDFNENCPRETMIANHLQKQHNMSQLVSQPTTDYGSTLDHVYCNTTTTFRPTVNVLDTYYSDHSTVVVDIEILDV